jgi:hypothetical protein
MQKVRTHSAMTVTVTGTLPQTLGDDSVADPRPARRGNGPCAMGTPEYCLLVLATSEYREPLEYWLLSARDEGEGNLVVLPWT